MVPRTRSMVPNGRTDGGNWEGPLPRVCSGEVFRFSLLRYALSLFDRQLDFHLFSPTRPRRLKNLTTRATKLCEGKVLSCPTLGRR